MAEHEHDYELLTIVDQRHEDNIGHYRCTICGAIMVRPRGNDFHPSTKPVEGKITNGNQ